jgi:hypothetical protein
MTPTDTSSQPSELPMSGSGSGINEPKEEAAANLEFAAKHPFNAPRQSRLDRMAQNMFGWVLALLAASIVALIVYTWRHTANAEADVSTVIKAACLDDSIRNPDSDSGPVIPESTGTPGSSRESRTGACHVDSAKLNAVLLAHRESIRADRKALHEDSRQFLQLILQALVPILTAIVGYLFGTARADQES